MGESTDREELQEDQQQPGGSGDHGDHRGRAKRREVGQGKQAQHSGADVDGHYSQATAGQGSGEDTSTQSPGAPTVAALQARVAEEQAKAEDAALRLARTQADFANYKRRNEQEREQQARFANLLMVSELLPVLDNLDRALATLPESVAALPWTDGLLLVDRQLRATLEKQGLLPINAVGARFDPMLHEAIIHEETSEHPDDEVIAELRRGYMLHDKVVRPTLVKVAKHVEPAGTVVEER